MINLLPSDYKESIVYARRNWFLRKWIIVLVVSLFGIMVIVGAGNLFMGRSINHQTEAKEAAKKELDAQNINKTKRQLTEVSNNTNLVIKVLSKEVLFSKLIRELGASLPSNTALEEIKIENLDGGITLKALASDINAGSQLQINLSDPSNKIFAKVDIESINCDESSKKIYPCSVQLKALFSGNNSFTYLPSAKQGKKP